ncbi:DUF192 domain-containing protein [Candidatus Proelusimicrobium volucris]|uniref:DUF192 domain-containing protein n=1 Tax=Candidatus Proelusimicrobium volucris TaxID=3416225 RepID=UPI003D103977
MRCLNLSRGGAVIADKLEMKDSFFGRLIGLLSRSGLKDGEGIILNPCTQIHTFFMRFSIDAVFLSRDMEVISVIEDMKPWRVSPMYFKAKYTLEVRGGYLKGGVKAGDKLVLED